MLRHLPLTSAQVRTHHGTTLVRTLVSAEGCSYQNRRKPESDAAAARFASAVAASAATLVALQRSDRTASCYYDVRADGSVDRLSKWKQLWDKVDHGGPAFHSSQPQKALLNYLSRLDAQAASGDKHILVPMCGKTGDIPHLCEQGFDVVGVECAQKPIVDFQSEQRHRPLAKFKGFQKPERWSEQSGVWEKQIAFRPASSFEGERPGWVFKKGERGLGYYSDTPMVWRGHFPLDGLKRSVDIIQADVFEVKRGLVACATDVPDGMFNYAYDRGAFVTVPPAARGEYVSTLSALIRPGGKLLLVTAEYSESSSEHALQPKHYNIPLSEVRRLFPGGQWKVEELGTSPAPYLGRDSALERVYLITKKEGGAGSSWKLFALGSSVLISSVLIYRTVLGVESASIDG